MSLYIPGCWTPPAKDRFTVTGPDGEVMITIGFDPPEVIIAPELSTTGAAKLFWNEVCRLAGRPPVFHW